MTELYQRRQAKLEWYRKQYQHQAAAATTRRTPSDDDDDGEDEIDS